MAPRKKSTAAQEKKVYSWVKLLESRHAKLPEKEPVMTQDRGRPRLNVATYQTSVTLTKGDREAIDYWQQRLSVLLNRKVSIGETVGFLARVCQERIAVLDESDNPEVIPGDGGNALEDLVHLLVSG